MQLIRKVIKGNTYWYLVEKGRKNGVVTNVKTVYIGSADRLFSMLSEAGETSFPSSFESWEVGASAALCSEMSELDVIGLIDGACPSRRSDATLSYGNLLSALALHKAIAPCAIRSQDQLRAWYEGCGARDLLPMDSAGLDARRVHEALHQLRAADLDRIETAIVAAVAHKYQVARDVLAFDTSNFDSYVESANPSQLLKRGHAKSKKTNLRVLGLGLLVTPDDGLPLMWFVYPGNHPDVRSFRSFLSRLKRHQTQLGMDTDSTVVCDGGNICKATIERIEADPTLHLVARLPTGHAPEADLLSTEDLPVLEGSFGDQVRAKMLETKVYGKIRTVVAVHSASMHASQIPGLKRDIRKATEDLEGLAQRLQRQMQGKARGKPLTIAAVRSHTGKILERQHMAGLFQLDIAGNDAHPTLTFRFDESEWKRLEQYRLGRTSVITDRPKWTVERIVSSLREQSHVEFAFRQLKDPQWASAVPLRHHTDPMLRVHALVSVLALLLSKLVVRRLKLAGIKTTVNEALHELSELRLAKVNYGTDAPAGLKALALERRVPPKPNALQAKMVRALGIADSLQLGPTKKPRVTKKSAAFPAKA
jgi:transposase